MRRIYTPNTKTRINNWDWLLIIGLSMAPMTSLRIWKIGPAELLCAVWAIRYLSLRSIRLSSFLRFFAGFIVCMLIGSVICMYINSQELSEAGILTWLYLATIACVCYSALKERSSDYIEKLADRFACTSVVIYSFLYIYSVTISRSFLGVSIWYHNVRFSPLGNNPHQVAVLMSALPFLFIRNAVHKKNVFRNLTCTAACVFLMLQTTSSTGIIALIAGFITLVIVLSLRMNTGIKEKISILIIEAAVAALIVLVFWTPISNYIYNWIASDSNGLGRLQIFSHITETLEKSPVFGLGPGTHSESAKGGTIEYHCTYLEIIAAAGLSGMLFFIILSIREFKTLLKDTYLLPIMAALYAYGISGFAMRRLAYWGLTALIVLLAEKLHSDESLPEYIAMDEDSEPEDPESGDPESEDPENTD